MDCLGCDVKRVESDGVNCADVSVLDFLFIVNKLLS